MTKTEHLVLGTVNAPFKMALGEEMLAACLKNAEEAAKHVSQLAVFFGEVTPDLQQAFAREHDVADADLIKTCNLISELSGQNYPLQAEHYAG